MERTAARGAVVITGASTGIGRATALHLDRLGHRVFAGVRQEADAESLRQSSSARLSPVFLDVTTAASIQAAATTVAAEVGETGLAGVVNNAGIGLGGPLEFFPIDELRRQFEINIVGPLAVTQAFLPLVRRGRGRIVLVGSIGSRRASPIAGPYNASKFALEALADALRLELRPEKIHVALIQPGAIATPIFEKVSAYGNDMVTRLPEEGQHRYQAMIQAVGTALSQLQKHAIPPENVAYAIAHALTAVRPKTHYLVGIDARIQALAAWLLPTRLRDALTLRLLRLPT
jgi:NAD(P)-dependent dehydrogenase (short-subunit alcohol dehydrogenase family)